MYSKLFLLFSISFIFFGCSKPKENNNYGVKNDSVEKYLKLADNNKFSLAVRNQYNKEAFSFVDLEKTDTTTIWYLYYISKNTSVFDDSLEYKLVSKHHNKLAINNNDTLNLARYYRIKGAYYRKRNSFDSAFFYYKKSEKLYLKYKKAQKELAFVYHSISYVEECLGDYLSAEFYSIKSLLLIENTEDYKLKYELMNNLGNINHNLKKYNVAINYHLRALNLIENKKIDIKDIYGNNSLASSFNNIGNSYRELKEYKKSYLFF